MPPPPPGSDATAFADGKENKPGQYFVYRLPTRHTGQWSRRRPGVMKKAHSRLFIDSMYSAKDLKNIFFFKICRIMTSLYDVINVSAKSLLHIKYAYGSKVNIDSLLVKFCGLIVLL